VESRAGRRVWLRLGHPLALGSTPGRMIALLTPGGFERLWEEEAATQLTTPPPVDPGVIEKLIALAPTYHLQIPPLAAMKRI
jgi:hypothetical protein